MYEYPKLNPDWSLWILHMKIKSLGLPEPTDLRGRVDLVAIGFKEPLSVSDKSTLDALMADIDAGSYPASENGFTIFEIDDIYDMWRKIEDECGIKIRWIFCNIPWHDKIMVWVEGELTTKKEKDVLESYSKLCKVKAKT